MIEHVFQFIKKELQPDTSKVTRTTEQDNDKYTIPYQHMQLVLEYGKYGNDLILYNEGGNTPFEVNKLLMQQIGKGFNAILGQGKYQDVFTEEPRANQ